MTREILGNEIAKFTWKYGDWYDITDSFETYEEFVTEIISALYDAVGRKVIALVLKEYVEWWEEEDYVIEKAAELYRKVIAL